MAFGYAKSVVDYFPKGMEKALNSEYAYCLSTLLLTMEVENRGDSNFHVSADGFFPNYYGIIFRKGSPIEPVINRKQVISENCLLLFAWLE
jgi:hypothetical protein